MAYRWLHPNTEPNYARKMSSDMALPVVLQGRNPVVSFVTPSLRVKKYDKT